MSMKHIFSTIAFLTLCAVSVCGQGWTGANTDLEHRTYEGPAGKPLSGKIIYLNPGHGSWGPNDRPCATIPYKNLAATGRPDTCGFYESNTDLWKMEELRKRLVAAGAKVIMSRIGNGPYPYISGASNAAAYNRNLSEICEEVETQVVAKSKGTMLNDIMFFSLHSNATTDGTMTNYPLMLYRGTDALDYVYDSRKMSETLWDSHVEYMYKNGFEYQSLFTTSRYVKGDITFYGSSSTRYSKSSEKYYTGYLGVLKHGAPGLLSEGFFHTYQPARHRALNQDYCRQEGLRYYRGIIKYFQVTDNTDTAQKGYIMGAVKDPTKSVDNTLYNYKSGTPDEDAPIMGATVRLRKMSAPATVVATYTTDQNYNGVFVFWDLEPGDYYLDVKAPNYVTQNGGTVATGENIYTYANGYTDSKRTTSQVVTVKANETVYPYLFMQPGVSTDFDIHDPDPEPEMAFDDLKLKTNGATISVLSGKTIRRAIYRNGYLYVLACSNSANPYIYVINTSTRTCVQECDCSSLSAPVGYGNYTSDLYKLSDIAMTSDGVLVGCNKEVVGVNSESSYYSQQYQRFYKWAVQSDGTLTGGGLWFEARYNSSSGYWNNAYAGETMAYNGSSTTGQIAVTAISSGGYVRYCTYLIAGGTYTSGQRHGNKYASALYGLNGPEIDSNFGTNVRLIASPSESGEFIMDGSLMQPHKWHYVTCVNSATEITSVTTLKSGLADAAANGGSWFQIGEKYLMAYPTNSGAGQNTGVQLLNITSGLGSAAKISTGGETTLSTQTYGYEMAAGEYNDDVLTLYLLLDDKLYIWNNYVEPPHVDVTSVVLNKGTMRLNKGENEQLIATVLPDNATNKNVTWSSSNTSVATVAADGTVTAVASGTATITCTTEEGSHTATCNVTVYTPITGITLEPTAVTLPGIGHTKQLVATVLPAYADNQAVEWNSSDEKVAKVSATGVVTSGIPGTATITCSAKENSAIKATATITVQMAGRYTVGTEGQNFGALQTAVGKFEDAQSNSSLVGDVTLAIVTDLDEAATGLWNTTEHHLTIEPEESVSPTITYKTSGSNVLPGGLVIGSSTLGNTSRVSNEAKNINIVGAVGVEDLRQLTFTWNARTDNPYEGALVLYGKTHNCSVEKTEVFNLATAGSSYAYGLQIRTEQNDVIGNRPHDILVKNNHLESFTHPSGQSIYISGDYKKPGNTGVTEDSSPFNIDIIGNELVATTRGIFIEGGKNVTIEDNIFDVKQLTNSGFLSHGIYGYYTWGDINIRKNKFYRLQTINVHTMPSVDTRYGIQGITAAGKGTYYIENNYITGFNSLTNPSSSQPSFNVIGVYVTKGISAAFIRHNTIVMPELKFRPSNKSTSIGRTACIYVGETNTTIQNNILVSRDLGGNDYSDALIFSTYIPSASNATYWDYNVFEYNQTNTRVWASYDGSFHGNRDFSGADSYQSRGIGDAHSVKTTVPFANVAEGDLALVGDNAELENLRVEHPIAGITTDIVGTKRDKARPYAGAYEVFVWEDGRDIDIVDWDETSLVINLNSMPGMTDYSQAPRVEINGLPATVEVLYNPKHETTPMRTYRVTPTDEIEQGSTFTINVLVGEESIGAHQYTMPYVVSSDYTITEFPEGKDGKDIAVRDGAVLTIGADLTAGRIHVNAGSKLYIPTGKTLTVDSLYLRSEYDEVAELEDEGTLDVRYKLYFTKMLADNQRYYFMAVPYEVANAATSLQLSNMQTVRHNNYYRLRVYDGEKRAASGEDPNANWKLLESGALQPMKGYAMLTSTNNYREYLFPMTYSKLTGSQSTDVSSYVRKTPYPSDGGWNWLANPFTFTHTGAVTFSTATGPKYENMYLTLLGTDGTYYQEYAGFSDHKVPPFTPVFVQIKEENAGTASTGTVSFDRGTIAHLQAQHTMDADTTIWVRIQLTAADGEADEMGIRLHPSHTDVYEVGKDLQKWYSAAGRPQVYSRLYDERLAFAAVDDAAAEAIPMGYYAAHAGTMTMSLSLEQDELQRVRGIYLLDTETGREVNLMESDYTFSTLAGETTDRFVLRLDLEPLTTTPGVATDMDAVPAGEGETQIYDVLGRRVAAPQEGGVYILYNPESGVTRKIEK